MQSAQALERGEAPDFVAAAGHLESVDVERREQLAFVGALDRIGEVLSH